MVTLKYLVKGKNEQNPGWEKEITGVALRLIKRQALEEEINQRLRLVLD